MTNRFSQNNVHLYDRHAFIQKEIGQRLLARLDVIKKVPRVILEVGSKTGLITRLLQQKFPQSDLLGIDSYPMCHFAKSQSSWHFWKKHPRYLCASPEQLALKNQSIELLFSSLSLPWCLSLKDVFVEFKRVLAPQGALFFSTFGSATLQELRHSWTLDYDINLPHFVEMHDIGDQLLKQGFTDPVMDREIITVNYSHLSQLLRDLKVTSAHAMDWATLQQGFSKKHLQQTIKFYQKFKQSHYPATFEIIYGHAWQSNQTTYSMDKEGMVRIPANKIPVLYS